jgi:hypothetical protein
VRTAALVREFLKFCVAEWGFCVGERGFSLGALGAFEAWQRLQCRIFFPDVQRLTDNKLAVEPAKCVWRCTEVEFLLYIINRDGIKMSQEKVEAVLNCKYPTSLNKVQFFFGFVNFYRHFIRDYSRVARPLAELTKGEANVWKWTDEGARACDELKLRSPPRRFSPTSTASGR